MKLETRSVRLQEDYSSSLSWQRKKKGVFRLPEWYIAKNGGGEEKEDAKPSAAMRQTLNPDASIDYVTGHVMSVFSCNNTGTPGGANFN